MFSDRQGLRHKGISFFAEMIPGILGKSNYATGEHGLRILSRKDQCLTPFLESCNLMKAYRVVWPLASANINHITTASCHREKPKEISRYPAKTCIVYFVCPVYSTVS